MLAMGTLSCLDMAEIPCFIPLMVALAALVHLLGMLLAPGV